MDDHECLAEEIAAARHTTIDDSGDPHHRFFHEDMEQMDRAWRSQKTRRSTFPEVRGFVTRRKNLFDGCASERGGKAVVLVAQDTYMIIWAVFSHMLACQELFRDLGDAAAERYTRETIPPFRHDRYFDEFVPVGDLVTPVSQKRALYATLMSRNALRFVVAHEWAHIAHGHLLLLREEFGFAGALSEFHRDSVLSDSQALLRRTLEMDADCMAMAFAFWPQVLGSEDKRLAMTLTLAGIFGMLVLWDIALEQASTAAPRKRTHPSARVRYGYLLVALRQRMASENSPRSEYLSTFDELLGSVCAEVERAVSMVLGSEVSLQRVMGAFTEEAQEEVWSMNDCWAAHHDRLSRLTHDESLQPPWAGRSR